MGDPGFPSRAKNGPTFNTRREPRWSSGDAREGHNEEKGAQFRARKTVPRGCGVEVAMRVGS